MPIRSLCNMIIPIWFLCQTSGVIPGNVLNTYCWIMSTFSVPAKNMVGKGNKYAYAGVEPYIDGESDKVVHAYYQWVPFVLFFQVSILNKFILAYFWTRDLILTFCKELNGCMILLLLFYCRAYFFMCRITCGKYSKTERCRKLQMVY